MAVKAPASNQRGAGVNADPASAAQATRPFCQAAKIGHQPALNWTVTTGAAATTLGPLPIPASGGYLRRLLLEFVGTGGAGAAVLAADGPFSLISEVRFLEPNGTPVLDLSGYNLELACTYGGYAGSPDPRVDPDYTNGGTSGNLNWEPYIPVEIDTTGRGSLADLSSSSAFQLYLQIAQTSAVWSTAPTTLPSIAVNTYQEFWTLPNDRDADGNPQATAPPYPSTIQLWSQLPNIGIANNQRVQLNRMGNQLRVVLLVFRSGGARAESPAPNPFAFRWDDVILENVDLQTLRKRMREYVNALVARDTGVYAMPFNFGLSRFVGGNGVSSYLPTVTATRFEISGPNSGGTVDFVVNEVTSAPVSGIQRTSVGGGLQYYPPNPAPAGPGTM
jgi:hypothetical protein